jgi:hypothetical protein
LRFYLADAEHSRGKGKDVEGLNRYIVEAERSEISTNDDGDTPPLQKTRTFASLNGDL